MLVTMTSPPKSKLDCGMDNISWFTKLCVHRVMLLPSMVSATRLAVIGPLCEWQ